MIRNNDIKKILLVTGGTGGHIYPALSIYKYLENKSYEVKILTDKRGLKNKNLVRHNPYVINVKGFAGKKNSEKAYASLLVLFSTIKAVLLLRKEKFTLVLSFGSYVQVPVLLAAKILKISYILHEANAVIGKANKMFWRFAKVRTSFYKLKVSDFKTKQIGMPVRSEIEVLYKHNYIVPKKNKKIKILIMGGSLGSEALSYNFSTKLCKLPCHLKKRLSIIHQVKSYQLKEVVSIYDNNNIKAKVKTFINDIDKTLKTTNLIICRAGASTIAENLIAGIPAIYIPISSSSNEHQYFNALKISRQKLGWIFKETEIGSEKFIKFLDNLLNSESILKSYSINCKKAAFPCASKSLYEIVAGFND